MDGAGNQLQSGHIVNWSRNDALLPALSFTEGEKEKTPQKRRQSKCNLMKGVKLWELIGRYRVVNLL